MAWLWLVASVAERFHVLPTRAAADLGRDPEMTSLVCLRMLAYADAKRAWDRARGDPEKLKPWAGSDLMASVQRNTLDLKTESWHRGHTAVVESCPLCHVRE